MARDQYESINGRGRLEDRYGRDQFVLVEKHQAPLPTDVQRGYEWNDADGRQQMVLLTPDGLDLHTAKADKANLAVNVFDHGAKGNGTTDDTAAINEALTEAAGRSVVLPAGRSYRLAAGGLVLPSNTDLWMYGATLLVDDDFDAITNSDYVNGNVNVRVRGGKVDGRKTNRTAGGAHRGIYLVNCVTVLVNETWLVNTEDHGLHFNKCEDYIVANSLADGCGKSDTSVGGSGFAFTIVNTDKLGIVSACLSKNNFRAGYRLATDSSGVAVYCPHTYTGCHARANGSDVNKSPGFSIQGDSGTTQIAGVSVNGGTALANGGDGLRATAVKDMRIEGGFEAVRNGRNGVNLRNGSGDCAVVGVIAKNNSQEAAGNYDGIRIEDDGTQSSTISVRACRSGDDQGVKTQRYGVAELNASNDNIITDNDLRGNLTGALSVVGARTVTERNRHLSTGVPSKPAAATLDLKSTDTYVEISATTTITAISATWKGRRVTLAFTNTATLQNNAGIVLKAGADFAGAAGRVIELVYDGTVWREV